MNNDNNKRNVILYDHVCTHYGSSCFLYFFNASSNNYYWQFFHANWVNRGCSFFCKECRVCSFFFIVILMNMRTAEVEVVIRRNETQFTKCFFMKNEDPWDSQDCYEWTIEKCRYIDKLSGWKLGRATGRDCVSSFINYLPCPGNFRR